MRNSQISKLCALGMNLRKFLLIFLLIFHSKLLFASHCHPSSNYNDQLKHEKLHYSYQIGLAKIESKNSHMPNESGAFVGFHVMSPINTTDRNSNFLFAAGAHTTFTENKHFGLMLGIMYHINESTMLSIMPGVMFMKHRVNHSNMNMGNGMMPMAENDMNMINEEWENEKAMHLEISHKMNLFHHTFTPSISWMSSSSHNQYSIGLNFNF